MIDAINAIASSFSPASPVSEVYRSGTVNTGFSDLVAGGLEQVNHQLMTSQVDLQLLASGEAKDLHNIMIRMEESRLSFQLLMQVRNRLLESYQDIMRMQI